MDSGGAFEATLGDAGTESFARKEGLDGVCRDEEFELEMDCCCWVGKEGGIKAGFRRSTETDLGPPGSFIVKCFRFRATTSYGPEYGASRLLRTRSTRSHTNGAECKEFG